jgi:hypothetical protein
MPTEPRPPADVEVDNPFRVPVGPDLVFVARDHDKGARARATRTDAGTNVVIGCLPLPETPPFVTADEAVERMERYRLASIEVDVLTKQLAELNHQLSKRLRRLARG